MSFLRHDEIQNKRANMQINAEVIDRLVRLESRLVQLMYFLGADPSVKYDSHKKQQGDKYGN